jgi:RNA recognition motif-containing protein
MICDPVCGSRSFCVGNKIYCGNLSYGVTKADLEAMFAEYGAVRNADLIMDRDTGQSKGFGFVEMENAGDAQKAIQGLNDSMHDGRPLKVNEAKPREDRSGGGGGGGGSRGGYNRGARRW